MIQKKFLYNFIKVLISILIFVLIYFVIFSKNYIKIDIKNTTNSSINNLKIVSRQLKNNINIPSISPNEKYKVKFRPSEEFTEGAASIELEYTNEQNQKEYFSLIGYTEGSAENVKVILKNYENGKLIIDINGEELTGISEKEMYGEK
ncbi:hypothetical protein [Clostridium baratii]|uniref:hypothetical protein n=1 Tax=Clostridium baratii TaxID=1561 RepID=UPI0030D25A70